MIEFFYTAILEGSKASRRNCIFIRTVDRIFPGKQRTRRQFFEQWQFISGILKSPLLGFRVHILTFFIRTLRKYDSNDEEQLFLFLIDIFCLSFVCILTF